MTVTREREINRRVELTTKRPEEEEAGYQGNWRERNEKKKIGLHHSSRKLLLAKQHRAVAMETRRTGIL